MAFEPQTPHVNGSRHCKQCRLKSKTRFSRQLSFKGYFAGSRYSIEDGFIQN